MKPNLVFPQAPEWKGTPPHLSRPDLELWLLFREAHASKFLQFYFDVRVGDPLQCPQDFEPNLTRMVEQLSRRRIDVVAEKENEWWLIELRPNAGPGAIGSALTYKFLWEEDPPDDKTTIPVIVTNFFDSNLTRAAKAHNIRVVIVSSV